MAQLSSKQRHWPRAAAFLAMVVLLAAGAAGVQATPVADSFFGMHIHRLDVPYKSGVSAWPFVKFRAWRIWGAYVTWYDLEPTKGDWKLDRLDRYVDMARRNGVEVVLTLGRSPTWASARPDELCGDRLYGCAAEPKELADWENYVRTLARRYKGQIRYYEVWNEPRFWEIEGPHKGPKAGYYSGTAKELANLAKATRKVLNEVDPSARVISPSVVSGDLGVKRLRAYLEAGGGEGIDVVGFHFYTSPPETVLDTISKVRDLMGKHGLAQKELWNTEMGFTFERPDLGIAPGPRNKSFEDVLDQETGAAYVSRALILVASQGVARFFWFNWDGEPPHPTMGLAADAGRTVTPMTSSYSTTRRWLLGADIKPCRKESSGRWVCELSREGRRAWLVWIEDGTARWTPPASWGVAGVETFSPQSVDRVLRAGEAAELTGTPILLKSDRLPWGTH